MAFEIRVPRGIAIGRLRPTGFRMLKAAPDGANAHDRVERTPPPRPRDEDVELAVREHLYGSRPSGRRA
jgi:hypothetical protein